MYLALSTHQTLYTLSAIHSLVKSLLILFWSRFTNLLLLLCYYTITSPISKWKKLRLRKVKWWTQDLTVMLSTTLLSITSHSLCSQSMRWRRYVMSEFGLPSMHSCWKDFFLLRFLNGTSSKSAVPSLFGTRDQFPGRQFFQGPGWGGWFWDDSSTLHSSLPPLVQPVS